LSRRGGRDRVTHNCFVETKKTGFRVRVSLAERMNQKKEEIVKEEDRKKGEPGETQFVGKVPNTPSI